jgi:cytochrome c oxidase subunit 2
MSRFRPLAVFLPLAAFVLIPACARRAAEEANPPAVVIAQDPVPESAGSVAVAPPPRELELAAEPCDPKDAEVFIHVIERHLWKVSYPDGHRVVTIIGRTPEKMNDWERKRTVIDRIVLPVGRPVAVVVSPQPGVTSFRILRLGLSLDVAEGEPWHVTFKPTRAGEFAILSGQGTVGSVSVVGQKEFDKWLADRVAALRDEPEDVTPAQAGRQLFLKLQCFRCHGGGADAKGPNLEGLFGAKVKLEGGKAVTADEVYIVESIRKPKAKVVEGREPIMPAFDKDAVSDEDVKLLVAYIKSLRPGDLKPTGDAFPPPTGQPAETKKDK